MMLNDVGSRSMCITAVGDERVSVSLSVELHACDHDSVAIAVGSFKSRDSDAYLFFSKCRGGFRGNI
jgi:hypothetical protein